MSRLSVIYGSKLPYWVTFMIDKFTIRELCNQIGNIVRVQYVKCCNGIRADMLLIYIDL